MLSITVFVIECLIMVVVFGVLVFGMLLINPVSFISDYPPEIQDEYYRSKQEKAVRKKLTVIMIIKKVIALIAFAFIFAWMAHMAGAETFVQGLLAVYGYSLFAVIIHYPQCKIPVGNTLLVDVIVVAAPFILRNILYQSGFARIDMYEMFPHKLNHCNL